MKKVSTTNAQNLEPLAELLAKTETEPLSWFDRARRFPEYILNYLNLDSSVDALFKQIRFETMFQTLSRYVPYFRPQIKKFELNHKIFGEVDQREHFLPVRLQTLVDQLVADGETPQEREKRRLFARWCAKRYRVEFFRDITCLNNAFAVFDPDSEAQYEPEVTLEEKQEFCDKFFDESLHILKACNFVELPRDEMTRLMNLRRPASLPLKANYDGFEEYRVFVRGVTKTPPYVCPRWKNAGRSYIIESENLSRVCILARTKTKNADGGESESAVLLKMFKNMLLEDLKQAAPNPNLQFAYVDIVRLCVIISYGLLLSALKLKLYLLKTGIFAAFVLLCSVLFQMSKSAIGFFNCQTKYRQRRLNALYSQTLASNRAAISLLVALAEDQEVKEIVLGYFAASQFDDWATEKEIDDVAEAWLAERFHLDVDFESDDAIRKLLEKRLIESREEGGKVLYRAFPLDEALDRLQNDWNSFVVAPLKI